MLLNMTAVFTERHYAGWYMQAMSHDSPWIHVFWCSRSWRNLNRVTCNGGANAGGVSYNQAFSTVSHYNSNTVQDRCIGSRMWSIE